MSRVSLADQVATKRHVPLLLAAFAVVVGSFLGSTYYVDSRLVGIDDRSVELARGEFPRVAHLAVLRTRLHDLQTGLARATAGDMASVAVAARAAEALEGEASFNESFSTWPGEGERWTAISSLLESVRDDARECFDAVARGNAVLARSEIDRVRAELVSIDHDLDGLIELNAREGARVADRLRLARRRVKLLSLGLDFACVVIAIGAALAALRAVRRSTALFEERARELEIFASRVAHDIRGPLTPVMLALQSGSRSVVDNASLQAHFERALRSLSVVLSVVDGLFAFATSGARPGEGARASLRHAVEGVLAEVASLAAACNAEVSAVCVDDADVTCAPGVLLSVISNLARNAWK